MRGFLLVLWLLVPIGLGAYHYGPGQDRMQLDAVQSCLSAARQHAQRGEHSRAVDRFSEALAVLPNEREDEARRIRLERAKSQMLAQQLPAAYNELEALTSELQVDSTADPALLADALCSQASAKYYLTWLMRLEGKPRGEWEPEIEASRQSYRLLAEQALGRQDKSAVRIRQEDLEAAIRLARLDLSELQALPLPSQCQGCCSGDCKGKKKGRTMNKSKGKQDARGASSGPPPDEKGN